MAGRKNPCAEETLRVSTWKCQQVLEVAAAGLLLCPTRGKCRGGEICLQGRTRARGNILTCTGCSFWLCSSPSLVGTCCFWWMLELPSSAVCHLNSATGAPLDSTCQPDYSTAEVVGSEN